jgi:hypothetical protein
MVPDHGLANLQSGSVPTIVPAGPAGDNVEQPKCVRPVGGKIESNVSSHRPEPPAPRFSRVAGCGFIVAC